MRRGLAWLLLPLTVWGAALVVASCASDGDDQANAKREAKPPVVMLIFDEFPTESLLGLSAELQYVDVVLAGHFKVALCVVAVVGLAGPHVVSGSALVRHDESDAVARAILDALNRRLSG